MNPANPNKNEYVTVRTTVSREVSEWLRTLERRWSLSGRGQTVRALIRFCYEQDRKPKEAKIAVAENKPEPKRRGRPRKKKAEQQDASAE